jgi:hypothetical protein
MRTFVYTKLKRFLRQSLNKDSVVPHIKNLFICHVATNDDIVLHDVFGRYVFIVL